MDRITRTVPTKFWNDHVYRCEGESPVGAVVKANSKTTTVEFTDEEFKNFQSDADYYADSARTGEFRRSDDSHLWSIGQSAIKTMEALDKQAN